MGPPGVVGVVVGCALVAASLSGCSDEPGSVPDGSSISAALRLVPNTKDARSAILVTIYGRADRAAGIETTPRTRAQELRRVERLTKAGVVGGDLGPNRLSGQRYGRLAYRPSDVVAEVTAGKPPGVLDSALGTFDTKKVLFAAARTANSTNRTVGDVEVVRWLPDNGVSNSLDTPLGELRGQAGRLAFTSDGVLAYAHTDRAMKQLIDVGADTSAALSADAHLSEVARRLDSEEVYTAYLSDVPIGKAGGGTLPRYKAIGIGAAGTTTHPRLVVVVADADKRTATSTLRALRRGVASGRSAMTNQLWAKVLTHPRLVQYDRTLVATFDVDNPTLWYRVVSQTEPLLATR